MKQPRFIDYPDVWGAIAAVAMLALILMAVMFFGREPRLIDVVTASSGAFILAWLFSLARMLVLFRKPTLRR